VKQVCLRGGLDARPSHLAVVRTRRRENRSIGGTDCNYDGPFGSYSWSVAGDELTLTAGNEGCGNRRAIWEGIWKRVR
jgi:hypothetical protein